MKLTVRTLATGGGDYEEFLATLRSWVGSLGLPLQEWTEEEAVMFAGHPKFTLVKMLREFLEGDDEVFCYVDADIFVKEEASLPEFPEGSGWCLLRVDWYGRWESAWRKWVLDEYGETLEEGYRYRNTGVVYCDRLGAEMLLAEVEERFRNSGFLEQHQLNVWLYRGWKRGLRVMELGREFNALEKAGERGEFMHFAGGDKLGRLKRWQERVSEPMVRPEFEKPSQEVWIVYPYLVNGSSWSDWELRTSLRSVAKNWKGRLDGVIVAGLRMPAWVNREEVEFRLAPAYHDAVKMAANLPGRVVWMNDDIAFLQPTGVEQLEIPRHQGSVSRAGMVSMEESSSSWRSRKGRVARWLYEQGLGEVMDYSTHTPYLYETDKMRWLMEEGPWFGYKTAFELCYFNYFHGTVARWANDVWRPHGRKAVPESLDKARFWNLTDAAVGGRQVDRLIRGYARGMFPRRCRFEVT